MAEHGKYDWHNQVRLETLHEVALEMLPPASPEYRDEHGVEQHSFIGAINFPATGYRVVNLLELRRCRDNTLVIGYQRFNEPTPDDIHYATGHQVVILQPRPVDNTLDTSVSGDVRISDLIAVLEQIDFVPVDKELAAHADYAYLCAGLSREMHNRLAAYRGMEHRQVGTQELATSGVAQMIGRVRQGCQLLKGSRKSS